MKKLLVFLATLLFAGVAFAQEEKKPEFTYGLSAWAFGVYGKQHDLNYDYSHIRVRPAFAIEKENVKGVMTLEIDQDFGREASSPETGADPGTDNMVVKVKSAYIQIDDLALPGVFGAAGLLSVFFPTVVDNDLAGYQLGYNFNLGSIVLAYYKIDEFEQNTINADDTGQRKDMEAYSADITLKTETITVRPGFMYFVSGQNNSTETTAAGYDILKAWNAGLNIAADFGIIGFDIAGAYLSGKEDKRFGRKMKGWATDGIIYIKPAEMAKIGIFGTYHTGDKKSTSKMEEGYMAIMDKLVGATDGRLFLLENGGIAGNGGTSYYDSTGSTLGLIIAGINAELTFEKVALFGQYGYVKTPEKSIAGHYLGQEADGKISYLAGPQTYVFFEGGYYFHGDRSYSKTHPQVPMSTNYSGWETAFGVKTVL